MIKNIIPNDLIETKELVFDKCALKLTNLLIEKEGVEYNAYRFELNKLKIVFRSAKITPTKIGQFVTLWKRSKKGPIEPYEFSDEIDLFIINTRRDNYFGQFIFPKSVLSKQGVITNNVEEGKRAIRVYPPWDKTTNKQAQNTQKWQVEHFLEIPFDKSLNLSRAKSLYFLENIN
jgi:hypothetical protein